MLSCRISIWRSVPRLAESVKKLKARLSRAGRRQLMRAARWNAQMSSLLINIILIVMILLSFTLLLMATSQVRLTVGADPSSPDVSFSIELLSRLFGSSNIIELPPSSRANILGTLISAVGAIVTAVFAMIAWMLSHNESKKLARNSPIQIIPVYAEDGTDDIEFMLQEYDRATSIVVFGGDFSWMREKYDNCEQILAIRQKVEYMASEKKIRLVSYRDENLVLKAIGCDLFDKVKSRIKYYDKLSGLRASFIEKPYGRVLIYKVQSDRHDMHICRVTDSTQDGKQLLDQFKSLIDIL